MFVAFSPEQCVQNKPTNKKSAFTELTSFKNFDSEAPSFYFGSLVRLRITWIAVIVLKLAVKVNLHWGRARCSRARFFVCFIASGKTALFCKSASKPLNAQYFTWARSNRGAITITLRTLHLHASDVHQHSTFNRSRAATLLWGTDFRSRPSINFRAYKWIPLSSNFWAINSRFLLITVNTRVFQRVWKMFGFLIIRKIFWLCSTYSVKPL